MRLWYRAGRRRRSSRRHRRPSMHSSWREALSRQSCHPCRRKATASQAHYRAPARSGKADASIACAPGVMRTFSVPARSPIQRSRADAFGRDMLLHLAVTGGRLQQCAILRHAPSLHQYQHCRFGHRPEHSAKASVKPGSGLPRPRTGASDFSECTFVTIACFARHRTARADLRLSPHAYQPKKPIACTARARSSGP